MEFEAFAEVTLGKQDELKSSVDKLGRVKPIHKPVAGANTTGGTAPPLLIVECQARPNAGRVWNLLSVSVFGSDAHTPPAFNTFQHNGQQAAPAANTNITGNATPSPGSYLVNWSVAISGTPASPADVNNFALIYSPSTIGTSVNPAAVGSWNQIPVPLLSNGTSTLHINNVGAATAGTVYSAAFSLSPQVTPGSLPQTFADVYAGALSSDAPATQQLFTDLVVSAAAIPSVNYVPDKAIWLHSMESIYAIIYNPPINSQFVVTARVGEYPTEAVESLRI